MKNIMLIFTVALGLVFLFSACEKNDKEPKFNPQALTKSEITTPADGT